MTHIADAEYRLVPVNEDSNANATNCCIELSSKVSSCYHTLRRTLIRCVAEERTLRLDMSVTASLYYSDIALDIKACITFIRKGEFKYCGYTLGSIVVNALVSSCTAGTEDVTHGGRYSVLGPLFVLIRAMRVKASPAKGKSTWRDQDIHASHQVIAELRQLKTSMQRFTSHEATIEAPVNTLIQMMAALHMHRQEDTFTDDEAWLWVSVVTGLLSMVKNYVAWDSYGRVHMQIDGFEYVLGACHSSLALFFLGGFRSIEISSRLCTLLAAHEALVASFDVWWMHLSLLVYLGFICLFLLCIGRNSLPCTRQHLALCLPGSFIFPGPAISPPCFKAACTSAAVHYVIRIIETISLLLMTFWSLNFDSNKAEELLGRGFVVTSLTCVFSFFPSVVCLLVVSHRHTYHDVKVLLANQLLVTAGNRILTRFPEDPNVRAALLFYGFEVPISQEKLAFTGDDAAITETFMKRLVSQFIGQTEDIPVRTH